MHGLPSLTKSVQMHGLQLVYLEVHACIYRRAPAVLRTHYFLRRGYLSSGRLISKQNFKILI